jgi:hypothetical protein
MGLEKPGHTVEEPEIVVHDREQLAYLLTEAAEIEHGLMCCYLYAAFSLKRGAEDGLDEVESEAVNRWRRTILDVAIDEMLHLSLVTNLLVAIGAPPHFESPNLPVSPGYHPAGVTVSLRPFGLDTLQHFVFLERPEGHDDPDGPGFEAPAPYHREVQANRLVPSAQDYATAGGARPGTLRRADRGDGPRLGAGGDRHHRHPRRRRAHEPGAVALPPVLRHPGRAGGAQGPPA